MPKVKFGGQSYDCNGVSVLDCLTAQGIAIPSSCHSGLCQTCMMQAINGRVPGHAQKGLKPTYIEQGYFLACSCFPEEDLEIVLPKEVFAKITTTVTDVSLLAKDILGIKLQVPVSFKYRAGQFINLYKDENTSRSYSLASLPALNEDLFLNVRKVPGGIVSNWIYDTFNVGGQVTISAAIGDCFYVAGSPEQNILLIGTGSGLAPLYGIVRDALLNKHKGEIHLYHGNYDATGCYLVAELKLLEQQHHNFKYIPCVSDVDAQIPAGGAKGMVLDVALSKDPDLSGWRIFLCGNPAMVSAAKTQTFLAGASMSEIFADPF